MKVFLLALWFALRAAVAFGVVLSVVLLLLILAVWASANFPWATLAAWALVFFALLVWAFWYEAKFCVMLGKYRKEDAKYWKEEQR